VAFIFGGNTQRNCKKKEEIPAGVKREGGTRETKGRPVLPSTLKARDYELQISASIKEKTIWVKKEGEAANSGGNDIMKGMKSNVCERGLWVLFVGWEKGVVWGAIG